MKSVIDPVPFHLIGTAAIYELIDSTPFVATGSSLLTRFDKSGPVIWATTQLIGQ